MPLALAASTSGFDLSIAVETTTQVAPSTFAAACQACTWYTSVASIASVGDASASLPLTRLPRAAKILANADIPDPPIPTKCGRLVSTGAIGPVGQVMVLLSVMCPPGSATHSICLAALSLGRDRRSGTICVSPRTGRDIRRIVLWDPRTLAALVWQPSRGCCGDSRRGA